MTFRVKGDSTSNILPKSVQVIRSNAFQEAKLDKIDLTNCDKMTEIENYGFALAAIAEIKLPENLKNWMIMRSREPCLPPSTFRQIVPNGVQVYFPRAV